MDLEQLKVGKRGYINAYQGAAGNRGSSIPAELVPAAGVEPATFRSGGERSNPLSYAGIQGEAKR